MIKVRESLINTWQPFSNGFSPHQNIHLPPFVFKTHWFNFFYINFELLSFHPISHQITNRIGNSLWVQSFLFFPLNFFTFQLQILWFVLYIYIYIYIYIYDVVIHCFFFLCSNWELLVYFFIFMSKIFLYIIAF